MRTRSFTVLGLLVLAVLLLSACGAAPQAAVAQSGIPEGEQPRTLTVTGAGQVFIVPDIAHIAIGVHTEGQDAAEAVAENNARSQEVAAALDELGIDPQDIQTRNFSIYPQQQFDREGQSTGITYMVDNTVFVTIRELDSLGEVLDAVVAAGANSINNIQFDVEDRSAALSEARQAAVANAQTQAAELADSAGVNLGPIMSVQSYGGGFPVPLLEGRGGGGAVMEAAASVPVSPGQMVLTAEVNLVYSIE